MTVSNTKRGFTPELRLFALVNDSYEFNRAVRMIGALVSECITCNRVDEFGVTVKNGAIQRCDPWKGGASIRIEVSRGSTLTILFDDPKERAPEQRVILKKVTDSDWRSEIWEPGSTNNKTICTDLGLQAAVNKSVEHLLREMATQLVACNSFSG